ncbi:MAG: RtcB family protein [Bacteroidales bacterium]|nr:RtcB family protein [Bacteroidales bacterium]
MLTIKGKYTEAIIFIEELEKECIQQIETIVNHPAFTNPVRIMPDAHSGIGSVIGFTMKLTDKVIPNVIGVDIGCGMLSTRFISKKQISLSDFDKLVKRKIPMDMNVHKHDIPDNFDFDELNNRIRNFVKAYNKSFKKSYSPVTVNDKWLKDKFKQTNFPPEKFYRSLGTLGSGNHFIELGKTQNKNEYFLTIHTGSRHFGNKIASYWQQVAKKETSNKNIPGVLAYLTDDNAFEYLIDMVISQYYAHVNRKTILDIITKEYDWEITETIETIHNYIDFNDFIIRKGAIRSYKNEKVIIPLNMRDGILVCEGKSNSDWNYSAPHGAGRIMSRNKAKEKITLEEFRKSMEGIYSTSINKHTIDESPFAYKDPKIIEKSILPTVNILEKIKPLVNIKGF